VERNVIVVSLPGGVLHLCEVRGQKHKGFLPGWPEPTEIKREEQCFPHLLLERRGGDGKNMTPLNLGSSEREKKPQEVNGATECALLSS